MSKQIEKTYYVNLPYACFGLITFNNIVTNFCPPIAKWMVGKDIEFVKKWVKKKGGTIDFIKEVK